jgi:hypothetical protein
VKRRILAATAIGVIAVVGYAVWWRLETHRFESAQWKNSGPTRSDYCGRIERRVMVSDLQKHHLKVGMTTKQTRKLLGAPYSVYADSADRSKGIWWEWLTGPSTLDCWTFHVRFVNGRLVQSVDGQT